MTILVKTSWFQKHATPAEDDGGFHWHSPEPEAAKRWAGDLFGGRIKHPSVALELENGKLWWGRTFEASLPAEQRRYTGLVVQSAEPLRAKATIPELASVLSSDSPGPWTEGGGVIRPLEREPRIAKPTKDEIALAARAMVGPSPMVATEAEDIHRLPRGLVAVWPWLSDGQRRLEHGVGLSSSGAAADIGQRTFAHYLGLVADPNAPADLCRRSWKLVADIARDSDTEATFAELARLAKDWEHASDLRNRLEATILGRGAVTECDRRAPACLWRDDLPDAGRLWNRVLNYWGRGFLADELGSRLAELLVKRIAVDHLFRVEHSSGPSPWRYLRRLRWEAVLPADRTRAMLAMVLQRAPSLAASHESF